MMKARSGSIVAISSVIGLGGNAGQANYAAAKAGMIGMAKSLAKEVGSRGIRVNVVAPGYIETDMTADLADDVKAKLLDGLPLARLGTAQDVAGVVAFLCSPAAAYMTGAVLPVDGGMAM
jgi:3-oxoacyl-[acyl-carrier protein] reductase